MKLVIINKTKFRPPVALLRQALVAAVKRGGTITVVFVRDQEMRKLNRETRSKNKSTDVLSFPAGQENFILPPGSAKELGSIVINVDILRENFKPALVHHLVHGALHLLGKHHGTVTSHKKIMSIEDRLLLKLTGQGHP